MIKEIEAKNKLNNGLLLLCYDLIFNGFVTLLTFLTSSDYVLLISSFIFDGFLMFCSIKSSNSILSFFLALRSNFYY